MDKYRFNLTVISRDALSAVPARIKEAADGMGATHWKAVLRVILPTTRCSIRLPLVASKLTWDAIRPNTDGE
jgi:ABC-type spermidine/putrescine transport system permease subunit II